MDQNIVISVDRKARPSEKWFRYGMAAMAVVFLLLGIVASRGFMLPCFCMAITYYIYTYAVKRQYEYTLEDRTLKIDRVSSLGRRRVHEIPFQEILLLCRPDDPAAKPYKKQGGSVKIRKMDYTSYRDDVPYYTMIAKEDGEQIKLLLDLTPEAISAIRRENRSAVLC